MSDEMTKEMSKEQENGQITYATEVIATIVSVATTEVEGISGITGNSPISGIIGKGRMPRGVKVDVNGSHVSVDISVSVDYGIPIQKVGRNCQENVRKSIETMTGLTVDKVDLHVVSVSFEKENQEMQQSQKLALALEREPSEDTAAKPETLEENAEPAAKAEPEVQIEIVETPETEEMAAEKETQEPAQETMDSDEED